MLVKLSKDPMRLFDDIRSSAKTSSMPAFNVDISEDETGFHIDAELPGIAKDEIALNIEEETSGQIKFREKIKGRVAARDIYDTLNNKVIVSSGEIITEELAELIQETPGVEEAEIRSVLTCESKIGICSKCYGTNLIFLSKKL